MYVVTADSSVIPWCSCEWALEPWAHNPLFLPGKIRPCGQEKRSATTAEHCLLLPAGAAAEPRHLTLLPACPLLYSFSPWHQPELHGAGGPGMLPQSICYCHRAPQIFVANSNYMLVSKSKSYLKRSYPKNSDLSFHTLFQMLTITIQRKKQVEYSKHFCYQRKAFSDSR